MLLDTLNVLRLFISSKLNIKAMNDVLLFSGAVIREAVIKEAVIRKAVIREAVI